MLITLLDIRMVAIGAGTPLCCIPIGYSLVGEETLAAGMN